MDSEPEALSKEGGDVEAVDDSDAVDQGRFIFFLGVGLLMLVNLAAAILRFVHSGNPSGFVRLALLGVLLYVVYRGASWARVLVAVLLGLSALVSFLGALGTDDAAYRLISIGIGGIQAAFAGTLVWSAPLRAFLSARGSRSGDEPKDE